MSKYIEKSIYRRELGDRHKRRKKMENRSMRTAIVLSIALALFAGVAPASAQVVIWEEQWTSGWADRWHYTSEYSGGLVRETNTQPCSTNQLELRRDQGNQGDRVIQHDFDPSIFEGYSNLKLIFEWRVGDSSGSYDPYVRARWNPVEGSTGSQNFSHPQRQWNTAEIDLPGPLLWLRFGFMLDAAAPEPRHRRVDCVKIVGCPVAYAGPVSPSSQTVCPGTQVTFSLPDASGGDPNLEYSWWRDDSVQVGSQATHTTSTPGKYTCAVKNSCNPTWVNQTSPGYLYNHTLPSITSHPSNQTKCVGQTATFSVTASGSPAPTYQWQVRPSGGSWGNISGATSASYTTPTLLAGDNGKQYRCVATNTCGSATSNAATLTVNPLPTITSHPSDQAANVGGTATFSVVASDATGYQWQKNGSNISGATNSSYTTPSLTAADDGNQYRCIVSNACGNVTSNVATLTILADVIAVGMSNQALGGGDWFYDAVTGAGQKGISEATGLNTVGMLVRVWGSFTYLDAGAFAIDDGSGVTLRCEVPGNVTLDPAWQFVVVNGISSSYEDGGQLHRLIRVRSQNDIIPVN